MPNAILKNTSGAISMDLKSNVLNFCMLERFLVINYDRKVFCTGELYVKKS